MDQSIERLLQKTAQYSDDTLSLYDGCPTSSQPATPDPDVFYTEPPSAQAPNFVPGPVHGGYRTRHLSCILENWSESESYTSLPTTESAAAAAACDDAFAAAKPMSWEAEDVDEYITTLDESCILDIQSIERIDRIDRHAVSMATMPRHRNREKTVHRVQAELHSVPDEFVSGGPVETYPNIMTASCYGSLAGDPYDEQAPPPLPPAPPPPVPESDVLEQLTQMLRNTEELMASQQLLQQQQQQQQHHEQQQQQQQPDYLILNPPLLHSNQPKCRSPLPVSLNSSFCEVGTSGGCTSMNNSFYEVRSMQTSIDFGAGCTGLVKNGQVTEKAAINPLDVSFLSQDGCTTETVELMVDNGEYNFMLCIHILVESECELPIE